MKYLDKIVDLEINSVPDGSEHGKEYVLIGILYKDLRMRGSVNYFDSLFTKLF